MKTTNELSIRLARRAAVMVAASATMALAACGDGGGDDPAVPQPVAGVPASATASPAAYTRYVGSLAASETALPLDLSGVDPPTSETESPLAL